MHPPGAWRQSASEGVELESPWMAATCGALVVTTQ